MTFKKAVALFMGNYIFEEKIKEVIFAQSRFNSMCICKNHRQTHKVTAVLINFQRKSTKMPVSYRNIPIIHVFGILEENIIFSELLKILNMMNLTYHPGEMLIFFSILIK